MSFFVLEPFVLMLSKNGFGFADAIQCRRFFLGFSVAQYCDLLTLRHVLYVVGAPRITYVGEDACPGVDTFHSAHKLLCEKCVRHRQFTFQYSWLLSSPLFFFWLWSCHSFSGDFYMFTRSARSFGKWCVNVVFTSSGLIFFFFIFLGNSSLLSQAYVFHYLFENRPTAPCGRVQC